LVIGGTGFLGRHTVQALLLASARVEIITDGRSGNPWGANVRETICDRHMPCLDQKLQEKPWDLVVDFPIFARTDAAVIIKNSKTIRHYVFPSSDDIYMICNRTRFSRGSTGGVLEESAVRPSDMSARSKLNMWDSYGDGKKQLEEAFIASTLNFTALRLPDVWGPYESTGRFVTFLRMLEQGKPIGRRIDSGNPVFNTIASGVEFRPGFVFAKDVAQMILLLLRKGPQRQALNVAVAEQPTFEETVIEAHRALVALSSKWPVGELAFDDQMKVPLLSTDVGHLDIGKATALGFKPSPWRQGWLETIAGLFNVSRNDSMAPEELAKCIKHCMPTCHCEATEPLAAIAASTSYV
jgi:nucleoside-diphosphate-sugar epimerase